MNYVVVLETAHHVRDCIDLADVGEELVAEALALRGAFDDAGDVDEFDRRRHDLFGLGNRGEPLEPRVRHRHDANVRIDRAERVVLGRDLRPRQGIE